MWIREDLHSEWRDGDRREVGGGVSREKWGQSRGQAAACKIILDSDSNYRGWIYENLTTPLQTVTNKTDAAKTTSWDSCRDESCKS